MSLAFPCSSYFVLGLFNRYADDLLLFAADKAELWRIHVALERRLAGCRLTLHPHKTQLRPNLVGVTDSFFAPLASSELAVCDPTNRAPDN